MSVVTVEAALFSDVSARRKRLPAGFILLALLLHLLLLTISGNNKPLSTPPLAVSLEFELTAENVASEPLVEAPDPLQTERPSEPEIREQAAPAEPVRPANAETSAERPPVQDPGKPEEAPIPILVREQLLEAVARMDWQEAGKQQALARPGDSETLQRLYRPILPAQSNSFDGMTAPEEVEIMDQWLEADGAQRVVIRSPDGKTYCGRQEAVDAMRPWLQMPMMFHGCAGGGKRSGSQGWRNN